MDYFVLKRGEILGPFRKEELAAQLESHSFEPEDFAQSEGSKHWMPLGDLLNSPNAAGDESGAFAPDWTTLRVWAARRIRHSLLYEPMRAGFVSVGIGVLIVLLSWWPPLLWLPWLLAAAVAGVLLFRRGGVAMATLLLGCTLLALAMGWAMMEHVARVERRRAEAQLYLLPPDSTKNETVRATPGTR
jgi:hypothetical protein